MTYLLKNFVSELEVARYLADGVRLTVLDCFGRWTINSTLLALDIQTYPTLLY